MSYSTRGIGFDQRLYDGIKSTNTDEPAKDQSAKAKHEHRPPLSHRSPSISKVMCVIPPECTGKTISIPGCKGGRDDAAQI
jgi:hypothetical protein